MSLDVYLTVPNDDLELVPAKICIRENGSNRVISREEWDQRFPGTEPRVVSPICDEVLTRYSANITHNLGKMAKAAGVYEHLWRPEEIGITKASQLIEPLEQGLAKLRADQKGFEKHNPPNGWGTYESLVFFVRDYLEACKQYPDADVSASR